MALDDSEEAITQLPVGMRPVIPSEVRHLREPKRFSSFQSFFVNLYAQSRSFRHWIICPYQLRFPDEDWGLLPSHCLFWGFPALDIRKVRYRNCKMDGRSWALVIIW